MKKIAIVRGPSVTPWENQAFIPLLDQYALTAFSTSYSPCPIPDHSPIPVIRCFWWDSFLPIQPRLRWVFNGLCSRLLGTSYYMHGLEKQLQGFDIIHSLETHNTFSFQCARAKRRYGSKLVVTVWETIPFRGQSHPLRTWRKRQTMQATDAYIAISERARQMLLTEGVPEQKIHVIPMGIDCSHFAPRAADSDLGKKWGKDQGRFVVLCVARLVQEKGVYDLLQAGRLLATEFPDRVRFVFIGQGPEENRMTKEVARLNLNNEIIFAGSVPYDQMPRHYATADCFVLPSVSTSSWEEQFGYALVEAMAMDLPVISTRTGAIPEVVGNAGILVPPDMPVELAGALKRIITSPDYARSLGKQAHERALQNFQGFQVAAKLRSLYENI